MGTWGPGTFENDDASEWIYELEEAAGLSMVREALELASNPDGYLDAPTAAVALAAAEVVAALAGRPSPDLPDEVEAWVADHRVRVSEELRTLSLRAIDQVVADSGLKDRWAKSDEHDFWVDRVEELRARVAG